MGCDAPDWLDIRPDPAEDRTLSGALDPGESRAVALALQIQAARILRAPGLRGW
jgi:predicted nucleic acid-binding protein